MRRRSRAARCERDSARQGREDRLRLVRLPPLPVQALEPLESLARPPSRSYVNKRFQQVLDLAAIHRIDQRDEKLDIHALRHTAASRMARSGVGLVQAQKLLGHSDLKLTAAIYTHLEGRICARPWGASLTRSPTSQRALSRAIDEGESGAALPSNPRRASSKSRSARPCR